MAGCKTEWVTIEREKIVNVQRAHFHFRVDSTGEMSCLYMEPTQFKEIDTIRVKVNKRQNFKQNGN